MRPLPSLMLASTLALAACIARDAEAPDGFVSDGDGGPYDGYIADAARPVDQGRLRDGGHLRDAHPPVPDAARPVDAGLACARYRNGEQCVDSGCTWRDDACVTLAECGDASNGSDCHNQQCVWAADGCREPDDPERCADTDTAGACARRRCFWRRPAGEDGLGCWPDPAPSIQACAQPEPATCEAAGCEWTGVGCAPPNQTPCDQLDADACGARVECTVTAAGCAIDPDAACDGLALDDCASRVDCGVQGFACTDLPQDACPEVPQWVCEQRPDCEALRPDCSDAPKGGQGGGEGGAGGGGGLDCAGRADCADHQGCVDGECVACDVYIGCAIR